MIFLVLSTIFTTYEDPNIETSEVENF